MNVILQALAASPKVYKWIRSNSSNNTRPRLFDTLREVTCSINKEINDDENDTKLLDSDQTEFYAAQKLKRALILHNWKIRTEEHDCHELFHLIVSVLDDEQNENRTSFKSLNYFQPNFFQSDEENPRQNPFHGYLAIQFQCLDCNYKVIWTKKYWFRIFKIFLKTITLKLERLEKCIRN